MFSLPDVQAALREFGLDGWLLADFRGSNVLGRRIVGFRDDQMGSRRWFYFIPATGTPRKLVHRIESAALDHLPGEKIVYLRWQELEAGLGELVAGAQRIAMEYSPRNANPYVARVDAGTVELVRSLGPEIVSSGNLIQRFEATWDDDQWAMHLEAARHTNSAYDVAWRFIASEVRARGSVKETAVQSVVMDHFRAHGLTTYHPPIVGANEHSGDPHFDTSPATDVAMREGDFVLIDLWAKLDRPRSVYSDLTRVGFIGQTTPDKHERIFQIVAAARDAAIAKVRAAFAAGRPLAGWEVDQAAREVIEQAGYGEYFIHRTGHNIGQEVHGNGANMDNLETREERLVLPRTCFSIEPGIYLPEFGVRSEVDVFIDATGSVHVTGGDLQRQVVPILSDY
ncbi:MAG: M24 family metallopeptidase [Pirellulaceae bacterium]|nr:M24 family metallopeptidase [Pirellulaceae bacterium]